MYSFILLVIIVALFSAWIWIRIDKVADFRLEVIEKAFNFVVDNDTFDSNMKTAKSIVNKWSYDKMVFSLKPLKLEYWYNEDEIKFLNS